MPVVYIVLTRWDNFQKEARSGASAGPGRVPGKNSWTGFLPPPGLKASPLISEGQALDDWAAKGGNKR